MPLRSFALLGSLLVTTITLTQAQNLVQDPGFEDATYNGDASFGGGWNNYGGYNGEGWFAINQNAGYPFPPVDAGTYSIVPSSGYYGTSPATISQLIPTTSGSCYIVSFDYTTNNNPANSPGQTDSYTFNWQFGSNAVGSLPVSPSYTTYTSVPLPGTGSDAITFIGVTGSTQLGLDQVSVVLASGYAYNTAQKACLYVPSTTTTTTTSYLPFTTTTFVTKMATVTASTSYSTSTTTVTTTPATATSVSTIVPATQTQVVESDVTTTPSSRTVVSTVEQTVTYPTTYTTRSSVVFTTPASATSYVTSTPSTFTKTTTTTSTILPATHTYTSVSTTTTGQAKCRQYKLVYPSAASCCPTNCAKMTKIAKRQNMGAVVTQTVTETQTPPNPLSYTTVTSTVTPTGEIDVTTYNAAPTPSTTVTVTESTSTTTSTSTSFFAAPTPLTTTQTTSYTTQPTPVSTVTTLSTSFYATPVTTITTTLATPTVTSTVTSTITGTTPATTVVSTAHAQATACQQFVINRPCPNPFEKFLEVIELDIYKALGGNKIQVQCGSGIYSY